ncbi:Conserved hypothetical protein [Prochlorococcus marinus str. MIT 9313]|uniref:Uncharacterized protein n=1 Tax=Prochlorococcus marinus (strain MIT 9313) TaxID=74547 RepID=B9ESD4_PROMM|nr:Conserved hypothetical protein [Prochlorococcus marinus str. MIT 9313]
MLAKVHFIGVSFGRLSNFLRVAWAVWLPVEITRILIGCYEVTKISSTVSSLWCTLLMTCVNKWLFAYGLEYSLNDLGEA